MAITRKGGKWHVVVHVPAARRADIGRKQLRRTAESRAEALRLEARLLADLKRQPGGTLEDALLAWIQGGAESLKSWPTLRGHIRAARPFLAGRAIAEAPAVAAAIARDHAARGLAPATTYQRVAVVRRLARLAWRWGWVDAAPHVEMPRVQNARHVYLSPAQVDALAAAAGRSRVVVKVLAYTGLRLSEVWNADARDGCIHIRQSKTGKPRTVPLARPVRNALLPPEVSRAQFRADFERAREAIGMPHLHAHDLRHTCASMLVQAGVSLYVVGQILGHSSPSMTQRYAHLDPQTLRDAMERIG